MAEQILESGKRLSESFIWELQKQAYLTLGPKAWVGKGVPSYATSHACTVKNYVEMTAAYLRDLGDSFVFDQPLYLFELGAGSGRFCYSFLVQLLPLLDHLFEGKVKVRYVATDMVARNTEALQTHALLKPFVEQGVLDFAFYAHDQKEQQLELQVEGKILTKEEIVNPVVMISNYFFDTIPQDQFRVHEGKLEEGQAVIFSDQAEAVDPKDPTSITKLRCRFDYKPVKSPETYYSNKAWGKLLKEYASSFEKARFTFPSCPMDTMQFFSDLSGGRLLWIAADQGVSREDQITDGDETYLALHTTFSVSVNYHAMRACFQQQGGAALVSRGSDPIFIVMAGVLGKPEMGKELSLAFDHMMALEPSDYFKLVTDTLALNPNYSLEVLLYFVRLGNCDAVDFYHLCPMIRKALPNARKEVRDDLCKVVEKVATHFFPLSVHESAFLVNLGNLFYEMKDFQRANHFYFRARELNPQDGDALRNISSSFTALGEHSSAARYLEEADALG